MNNVWYWGFHELYSMRWDSVMDKGKLIQLPTLVPPNRTIKNRIVYALALFVVAGILVGTGYAFIQRFEDTQHIEIYVLAALAIILLIPGRVQQFYWKDYFQGQRLQLKGKHSEALAHFERFLKTVRKRPTLRHLIWFSQWFYTSNVEVMALNNMGVSAMWLQDSDKAESLLQAAAQLDPESPLPYFNLSVMHYALGADAEGAKNLTKAETLGYKTASIRGIAKIARESKAGDRPVKLPKKQAAGS